MKKKSKKIYKLPASAKEEPEALQHSKYEEEPVKKGKTHYEEDEEKSEEATEL